jgi:hypothetical protein
LEFEIYLEFGILDTITPRQSQRTLTLPREPCFQN